MEIGCVDCLHGCVWDGRKPSISDDGGAAGGEHIRHYVVLHSDTTERRPRQPADMEGCCDADWGLRFRKLQRTWRLPTTSSTANHDTDSHDHFYNSAPILYVNGPNDDSRAVRCKSLAT